MVLNREVAGRVVYSRVGGSRIRLERRQHAEPLVGGSSFRLGPSDLSKIKYAYGVVFDGESHVVNSVFAWAFLLIWPA